MSTAGLNEIAILDSCNSAILKAEKLSELTDLRSRAEALRVWAKSAHQSLEVQNRAAELRLLAERKAGKMLSQMRLQGGDRKSNGHDDRLILADLGITQNQSKRWQKEAAVSEREFAEYVRSASLLGKEITAAGLMQLARGGKCRKKRAGQIFPLKPIVPAQQCAKLVEIDASGEDETTGNVQEAIDHVNLLQQVLLPYAKGEAEGLSKSERRVVIYLLTEVHVLLQKVNIS